MKLEFCDKFLDLTLTFCIFSDTKLKCHVYCIMMPQVKLSIYYLVVFTLVLDAIASGDRDCEGTLDAWNANH